MASLADIYSGILKPGPAGGIYQPGPDVQFPSSSAPVTRVTPEGLNVRGVQTVAVDPFTGSPIGATSAGNAPTSDPRNANDVIVSRPAPTVAVSHPTTVNAANPLDNYRLGLTEPANQPAPLQAITKATTSPFGNLGQIMAGIGGNGFNGGWGSDAIGRFLSGDPGTTNYAVANGGDTGLFGVPAQGFARAPNPAVSKALLARGPVPLTAANPAVVKAMAPPAPPSPPPAGNFLADRGIDTSKMSAGQQANALAAQLAGSSQRGSFGV